MLTVEIVSHCWNYSRLLTYHLSALALDAPQRTNVIATVCFSPEDTDTLAVLDYFGAMEIPNVRVRPYPMERGRLLRRAIGRNEICRDTRAEYLLLSDVDYLLQGSVIDSAVDEMERFVEPRLWYPKNVLQSIDHACGDAEIERVTALGVYPIVPSRYTVIPLDRSIGGCQWIRGSWAREKGYLPDGHKFLREERQWRRTFCDARARGYWGLPMVPLEVQGVRRIRHGIRGRDQVGAKL